VLRFSFPISGNSAAFFKISDLLNPLHWINTSYVLATFITRTGTHHIGLHRC
jgi:hypothetical protein